MRWWWLLLFLLGVPLVHAQQDSLVPPQETVVLRNFDEAAIDQLKADPALDYDRDLRRLPSPWERFKEWLAEFLRDLLGTGAGNFITENLLYLLVAVLLIFALVMLSRGGLRRVFYGAPRSLAEVIAVDEDIREMDLAALIAEAESKGDLRRAIRLHYLLVLRKLVDQGVLHWSPDHTDRDYMAQIKDGALRARFTHVALIFQWVWYGHGDVHADKYAELRRPFVEFETTSVG